MVVAFAALCLAFAALDLLFFLNSQCGAAAGTTTTSAQAPLLDVDSVAEVLPPLAAVVVLFVAVAFTCRHLMGRHVGAVVPAAAGSVRRSISGWQVVMFTLCVAAGTLQFILFVQVQAAGGGAEGHGAQLARALGLAALGALPGAGMATFFLGVMLILVAHSRSGGEGGGGAVAADWPINIRGLLRLLTKVTAGAAAALVGLMLMALLSGAI